jgi:hypothetical protein
MAGDMSLKIGGNFPLDNGILSGSAISHSLLAALL